MRLGFVKSFGWCGLAVCALTGCGVRAEVAKDKLLARVDAMLGNLEVERKTADDGVKAARQSLADLTRVRIKAQVRADRLRDQIGGVERKTSQLDEALRVLRGHLVSNTAANIGGTECNPAQIKQKAQQALAWRTNMDKLRSGLVEAGTRLDRFVASLAQNYAQYEIKLQRIENQLVVVDTQRETLAAMKESVATLDTMDTSLPTLLEKLGKQVDDLSAEVQGDMAVEDLRWNKTAATQELGSFESLIEQAEANDKVIERIDVATTQPADASKKK